MCNYCSADEGERRLAQDADTATADRLERLAAHFRGLASGRVRPHEEAFGIRATAVMVVRDLAEGVL